MDKIKAAIIEDEIPAARLLRDTLLSLRPDWEVQLLPGNIEEAVEWFGQHPHPDILFLDIQLTDGNSFLFIEQAHPESMIVFTTAYDEYAVRAFSVNSIDYLLKPIHEDRRMLEILQQLSAAQETSVSVQKKYRTRFLISSGEKLFTLQVSDIAYFYSENKLTFAVTHKNREYLIDLALDRLSEQLDPDHFFRTNRQTLVCIDAIQRIESYFLGKAIVHVQPPFKDKIMISKDKMASFRMWLNY